MFIESGFLIGMIIFGIFLYLVHREQSNAKMARQARAHSNDLSIRQNLAQRFSRGDLGYSPWRMFDEKDRSTDLQLLKAVREIREADGTVYLRYKIHGIESEQSIFVCDADHRKIVVYGECADQSRVSETKDDYFSIDRVDLVSIFSSRGSISLINKSSQPGP